MPMECLVLYESLSYCRASRAHSTEPTHYETRPTIAPPTYKTKTEHKKGKEAYYDCFKNYSPQLQCSYTLNWASHNGRHMEDEGNIMRCKCSN